ncbi:MAG: hypothetical protein AB1422_16605 [bacterium]
MQNYKSNFKKDFKYFNAERKEIILLNFGKFANSLKNLKLKTVDS